MVLRKQQVLGVLAFLAASTVVWPAATASESGPTPSPAEPLWMYVPVDIDGDGLIEKLSFLTRDEYVFGSVFAPAPPYLPLDDTPGHYFGDYVGLRTPRYTAAWDNCPPGIPCPQVALPDTLIYSIDESGEATLVSAGGGTLVTVWESWLGLVRITRRAELNAGRLLLTFTVENLRGTSIFDVSFSEGHGFDDAQAIFEGDAFPGGQLIGTDHPGEEDRPLLGMVYAPVPDSLFVNAAATFNPSLATWFLGELGAGESASVQMAVVWSTAADPTTAHAEVVAKMVGQKRLLRVVPCSVEVKPETINLRSQGVFTAFIDFPSPFDAWMIDGATVHLAGAPLLRVGATGAGPFVAKFDRADLTDVAPGDAVAMTLTGRFADGTRFTCTDFVRVIDPPK